MLVYLVHTSRLITFVSGAVLLIVFAQVVADVLPNSR